MLANKSRLALDEADGIDFANASGLGDGSDVPASGPSSFSDVSVSGSPPVGLIVV